VPDRHMLLDVVELLRRELAGLEQHGRVDADLADVMHRGGAPDHLDLTLRPPELLRQLGREDSHALGVLSRFVVPVLRGESQALDDLELCLLQIRCALTHLSLKQCILVSKGQLQEAGLEEV